MSITTAKRVRVSFAFLQDKSGGFVSRVESIVNGLTGNALYPSPPINPAALKTALDTYTATLVESLDRGRKSLAARDLQRSAIVKMVRALGHYVVVACNDDLNGFMSSGFEPLVVVRSAPEPLPPARIDNLDHGASGQLFVALTPVPRAHSYELRFAPLAAAAAGGPWLSQPIVRTKAATAVNGLTPGIAYAFQVRTLGRLGFSDWSDSITKICA